jgi:hypothetical protein
VVGLVWQESSAWLGTLGILEWRVKSMVSGGGWATLMMVNYGRMVNGGVVVLSKNGNRRVVSKG